MKIYQIEQSIVEQNQIWEEIKKYVEADSLQHQAHEIEEHLFKKLLKLGKSLLEEVFLRFSSNQEGKKAVNIDGEELPCNGSNSRMYQSIFGLIEVTRSYFWKKDFEGFYPLDKHFNLPKKRYSHLLVKWTQDGVAEEPYEEALQRIERILGIALCKRGQEELSKDVTINVQEFYQNKPMVDPSGEGEILIATTDCKGVVMVPKERSEKAKSKKGQASKARDGRGRKGLKRDAVVTADYSINPEARTPEEMLKLLMRLLTQEERNEAREKQKTLNGKPRQPINKQVMASLNGKAAAFTDLANRLAKRDLLGKKQIFIQIDGDPSLEKGLVAEFKRRGWRDRIAGICLDIFHVMEYVWELSTSLHGEKGQNRVKWVMKQGLAILKGKVGYVIGGLKQMLTKKSTRLRGGQKQVLKKVITYFSNHKHMMKYDEYLAKGYPIGTGVIEGACGSLVKNRMERSGMKWTHKGAKSVLDLRALKRNGDWDSYWNSHLEKECNRLYGHHTLLEVA